MSRELHRVVVVGGGFGGLYAVRELRRADARVTLIDRRNHHLFQPLLYQVATGLLSPANIAASLRGFLSRSGRREIVLGEASDVDLEGRRLVVDGVGIAYDTLIVATGCTTSYFGHEQWRPLAPGLKSLEDALEIRERVLSAFERAEREDDPDARRALLTFAVVGGGSTGVEMSGALAELSRKVLRRDFRHIDPSDARILLFDALPRVLPGFPEKLSAKAVKVLESKGVTVRTGWAVDEIAEDRIVVSPSEGGGASETVPTRTVIWAAGVEGGDFPRTLCRRAGVEPDDQGRVPVEEDCTLPGHPEVFVLGDVARFETEDGEVLPGVAQVAMQQGRYAARRIRERLEGRDGKPFSYFDKGEMAVIGRSAGAVKTPLGSFDGFAGWLTWLFIHIFYLIEFQNRVLVFVRWVWAYLSWNYPARLIQHEKPRRKGEPPRAEVDPQAPGGSS